MPGKQRKNALLLDWGFRVQEFESSGKKGFLVLGLAFRGLGVGFSLRFCKAERQRPEPLPNPCGGCVIANCHVVGMPY